MNKVQLDYICRYMMETPWRLNPGSLMDPIQWEFVMSVFDRCQSRLEQMYLLGFLFHFAENASCGIFERRYEMNHEKEVVMNLLLSDWVNEDIDSVGIQIATYEMDWSGYGGWCYAWIVPQYKVGTKHVDFAIFVSEDSDDRHPYLYGVVEIQGYAVHRRRRAADEDRITYLAERVPRVFVIYEEIDNPNTWVKDHIVEQNDSDGPAGMFELPGDEPEYEDESEYEDISKHTQHISGALSELLERFTKAS